MLKRVLTVAALSAFAGSVVGVASAAQPVAQAEARELVPMAERLVHEHRAGELLVRFKAGAVDPGAAVGAGDAAAVAGRVDAVASALPAEAMAIADALQLRAVQRVSRDGLTLRMEAGGDLIDAMTALEASGLVEYAEPNYVYRTTNTPNDNFLNLLWGLDNNGQDILGVNGRAGADIRAEEAWDIWTGDPDYVIAVIDGGIDPGHPDLSSNMFVNEAELNGQPGVDDDGNGYIDDVQGWDFWDNDNDPAQDAFHGSHTSGTVAAVGNNGIGVTGVMWQAKVIPLRFIGPESGDAAAAALAIDYAVDMGARISNNSWGGGGFSQALFDALFRARDAGHIFVSSAGNNGDSNPNLPASYELPNVVSVANIRNTDQIAPGSSRGAPWVDIGAPGTDVVSTNGTGGYSYATGTSMASPHVAGAMGLLWSFRPGLAWEEVIDRTYRRSRPTNAMSAFTVTGGVVDAAAMLADVWIAPVAGPGRYVSPSAPATITAEVEVDDNALVAGSVTLHYRAVGESSFAQATMSPVGGGQFSADVPTAGCPGEVEFFVTADSANIGTVSYPVDTSGELPSFTVADVTPGATFDFESTAGWTVSGNATDGQWDRGVPANGGRGDPIADADGSGAAFVTDNVAGNSDVDGGSTTLTSPVLDASGLENPVISYQRWLVNDIGSNPNAETMVVQVSNNAGGSWTTVESVSPTSLEASGGWIYQAFNVADFVAPTATVQVRFTVADVVGTVIEGGVDDVRLFGTACSVDSCPADLAAPAGSLDIFDVLAYLDLFDAGDPAANLSGEPGTLDIFDVLAYLALFDQGC